jgi:hypothetical protein
MLYKSLYIISDQRKKKDTMNEVMFSKQNNFEFF